MMMWVMQLSDGDEHTRPPLITIDSTGGVLSAALATSSILKSSSAPIHVLNLSRCWSSAVAIFLSVPVERRLAMPHSTFMIHFGTQEIKYTSKQEQEAELAFNEAEDRAYDAILLNACTLSVAKRKLEHQLTRHESVYIHCSEAARMGWIVLQTSSKSLKTFTAPLMRTPLATDIDPVVEMA